MCHSEPKLCWRRAKFGNIGPIMPGVSWRVFKTLAKVSFCRLIRDRTCKKLPNVHENACDISYPCKQIYWPSYRLKNYLNVTFPHFADTGSWSTSEILRVAYGFWALNRNRWTKNMWYLTYFNKSRLNSFLIQEIPKSFTYWGFNSLLKTNFINFCPGV